MNTDSAARKTALRREYLAARWAISEPDRDRARRRIAQHICSLVARLKPVTVAAYVPVGTEPLGRMNTEPPILPELVLQAATQTNVLAANSAQPVVLLPIWRSGSELDWAAYSGVGDLVESPRGLWEPLGPRLGAAAIYDVDLVLVPALAADTRGNRLGRGAGCYDRALARTRVAAVAIVYDHELVGEIPNFEHDVPMSAVITPSGVHRIQ
ncbi:MAG: 5-formyltetrahydrofolate cyclo-ligase [Mycobacteriales bacterium]